MLHTLIVQEARSPLCTATSSARRVSLRTRWAVCDEDIYSAQRLRFNVFAKEMGAHLPTDANYPMLDRDHFDPYCEHLLVHVVGGAQDGALVGTYRVLSPGGALQAGGLYSETEFDLSSLQSLRARAVELGRACVHPDWRGGAVILALWAALGKYMVRHQLDTMIGCASISMKDGPERAVDLWHGLRHRYLADAQWQVQPYYPLLVDEPAANPLSPQQRPGSATPPLLRAYLRCGARLLGPPAIDSAFNTADLPIMLRVNELSPRYRKHFLSDA